MKYGNPFRWDRKVPPRAEWLTPFGHGLALAEESAARAATRRTRALLWLVIFGTLTTCILYLYFNP